MKLFETIGKLLEAIVCSLPYPEQIRDLDLTGTDHVYFTWRGTRYKVEDNGTCWELNGGCIEGSNSTLMLEALLKNYFNKSL